MITKPKTISVAALTAIAAGFTLTLIATAPASALPPCGFGGVSLGNGVCELTYPSGSATFTPVAGTTKLEALLVGGGESSSSGYGGGGGQVTLLNFTDTTTAVNVTVGAGGTASNLAGKDSSATQGATTTTARGGYGSGGGTSGNGNPGWAFNYATSNNYGASGGGAGASPTSSQDGGAGQLVASFAPSGSLFASDTNCYGGGGAIEDSNRVDGAATCGAGYVHKVAKVSNVVDPVANSGGGAGSSWSGNGTIAGGSGVVIVRWATTPASTVSYDLNGHGTAVASESVVTGAAATQPPDPSATGFRFNGWYTDSGLATKADFSAPISADTTFYASWTSVLAATGVTINPLAIPGAAAGISIGLCLLLVAGRRKRRRTP